MKWWTNRQRAEMPIYINPGPMRPPPPTIEGKEDPTLPKLGEDILAADGATLWVLVGIEWDPADGRGEEIRMTMRRRGDWRLFGE